MITPGSPERDHGELRVGVIAATKSDRAPTSFFTHVWVNAKLPHFSRYGVAAD